METYLRLANGSELRALRLYVRNAALASAFLSPMHILEVTLRNAVHDLLATEHGDRWYDMVVLTPGQAKAVKQARRGLRQDDKPETPGRMVASLGFGFWVALFTRSNDHPLWRPPAASRVQADAAEAGRVPPTRPAAHVAEPHCTSRADRPSKACT